MKNKRRFLSVYINPNTGKESLGTGADRQCFHYYANVENVIRYGLKGNSFPPGQYNIYSAPEGTFDWEFITVAYKRV